VDARHSSAFFIIGQQITPKLIKLASETHYPLPTSHYLINMKQFLSLLLLVAFVTACEKPAQDAELLAIETTEVTIPDGWDSFGEPINSENAVEISAVVDDFVMEEEKNFKISGTLVNVCQSKGCWTTLATDDGRMIKMTFANYGFFLPTDASGREIIAEGIGFKKVTTVDEQRHHLEDAGASAEEIAKITEEKVEYAFEATGVILKKS
jgi:hypothetical protein